MKYNTYSIYLQVGSTAERSSAGIEVISELPSAPSTCCVAAGPPPAAAALDKALFDDLRLTMVTVPFKLSNKIVENPDKPDAMYQYVL